MAILLFRTLLVYVLIIGAMRLMGKKQLGELQPSELVSTILISNLASISIESPELPLIGSVVSCSSLSQRKYSLSALCVCGPDALQSWSPAARASSSERRDRPSHFVRSALFTVDDLLKRCVARTYLSFRCRFRHCGNQWKRERAESFRRDTPLQRRPSH